MQTRSRAIIAGTIAFVGLALFLLQLDGTPAAAIQDAQQAAAPPPLVGADRGPQQPIAYSHRVHAGQYQMQCLYCHTNADISPFVPLPSLETCMGCHQIIQAARPEIQMLRDYQQRGEPVPWVRVHKLADFVQFNHSRHVRADLECQECHGPIQEMDVVYQWAPLTMGWCLGCHWQPADPDKLAAAASIAEVYGRPGTESPGLYPRTIDSDYGVTRAPIDCVACHY